MNMYGGGGGGGGGFEMTNGWSCKLQPARNVWKSEYNTPWLEHISNTFFGLKIHLL